MREVGNIELCELLETEPKTQCKVCIGTLVSFIARAGTSCTKKEERISNSSFARWTFFQFRSASSRKDDLTDTDMVKKPGDREYLSANQLKKKCKKKFFQGIHDRFKRDPEFRNRMIENNRDEDACRQWDALADEDNTHHLTPHEYSFYKSNWWLHSNKQGSNTVRTTHRSDFKKALSTLQQLKQKEEGVSQTSPNLQTPTDSHRNQQWAQSSSSWWNWQGSWWTPYS